MENIQDTDWDLIISGTGLQPSLLALALSRSDRRILHVDRNSYYGSAEAALSLQEAELWAKSISVPFRNARLWQVPPSEAAGDMPKLSFSRAYSLSLSSPIIYSRSNLLQALVSSKIFKQLEFQAVGSWWIYSANDSFRKVPNSREDVFADPRMDLKSKRVLMKLLKFVIDFENQREVWEPFKLGPISTFLEKQFNVPPAMQASLLALTLTLQSPKETTVAFAIPRIARHLRSIGRFGPGFAAVVPKWGGLSEISQVACRACAVGGGVYILGQDIKAHSDSQSDLSEDLSFRLSTLTSGETLKSRMMVTSDAVNASGTIISIRRSITVLSSTMERFFLKSAEGAPTSCVAVVCFPSQSHEDSGDESPPVYIMIHNSETGECPADQCVAYSFVAEEDTQGDRLIENALNVLTASTSDEPAAQKLFELRFSQTSPAAASCLDQTNATQTSTGRQFSFSSLPFDLALSEMMLEGVEQAWARTLEALGAPAEDFMVFDDRESADDQDSDT